MNEGGGVRNNTKWLTRIKILQVIDKETWGDKVLAPHNVRSVGAKLAGYMISPSEQFIS